MWHCFVSQNAGSKCRASHCRVVTAGRIQKGLLCGGGTSCKQDVNMEHGSECVTSERNKGKFTLLGAMRGASAPRSSPRVAVFGNSNR